MSQVTNSSILKGFPNPSPFHVHTITTNEFTFLGYPSQPDMAKLTIKMTPREVVPELKSVKLYLLQYRSLHISYEGVVQAIYRDFVKVYDPCFLYIKLETQPRGGISSVVEL